jgi:hypothetical protein
MAVATVTSDLLISNQGVLIRFVTLSITGMNANASNPVAHGLPLAPRRVWFTGVGSGVNAAACSLDTSTVAAGFDGTNIYIFTPAGVTAVLAHVEY